MSDTCAAGTKITGNKPCPKCGARSSDPCPEAHRQLAATIDRITAERDALRKALESAQACLRHTHDRLIDYDHEMETLRITINAEVRAITAALATSALPDAEHGAGS